MRAVVYDKYGPPDVPRIDDVEKPMPKEDEVLVRIHATKKDLVFLKELIEAGKYRRSSTGAIRWSKWSTQRGTSRPGRRRETSS